MLHAVIRPRRSGHSVSGALPRGLCLWLFAPVLALAAGGCSMFRLHENVRAIEQAVPVSGRVTFAGGQTSARPVIVALFREKPDANGKRLEMYKVMYQGGEFTFLRPPGNYYLLAFEDRNENFIFDADEPVGWYGAPTLIQARAGARYENLQLVLRPAPAARRELPQLYAPDIPRLAMETDDHKIGVVMPLDSPQFAEETGRLGMWEPVRFVHEYGGGIFFLQPYEEGKIPVLFVHGVGGYPQSFRALIANLDRTKFQPWVMQYPSGVRLPLVTEAFEKALIELQVRHRFPRLFLVAHSMGGLVTRGAIARLEDDHAADMIGLFVTISTPWNGNTAAAAGVEHSPVVMPCWYDMATGSPFLRELRATSLPAGMPYHLLFGYKSGGIVRESSDGTIALASMLPRDEQEAAVRVEGFDETHVSILDAPAVSAALNRILADTAARVPAR